MPLFSWNRGGGYKQSTILVMLLGNDSGNKRTLQNFSLSSEN